MPLRNLGIALLSLLIMGSGAAAKTPRGMSPEQESNKLQGSWRAVRLQIDGKPVDPEFLTRKGAGVSLDLTGNRFHFTGLGADFRGTYKVDMQSQPKRLVFLREDGQPTYSAFEWEDGQLKLAGMTAQPNAATSKISEVWVFKHEKP